MISVFGGSGFIGSRFCELYPDDTIKIPRNQRYAESNTILNFISTTTNYNIYENPALDIQTNLVILMEMLDANRKKFGNEFTFAQVSSWYVYGNAKTPIKEDAQCNPRGIYSISKRCAEQLLISYCETFDIKYKIFRLGNVIGENDNASAKKNALQYLMEEMACGRDIRLYNGGSFVRDYLYVDDVCYAIALCLDKAKDNEIMHIASGEPYKFSDLIEYCVQHLKYDGNITSYGDTNNSGIIQSQDMWLDITKLRNLGFSQKHSVYNALNIIINSIMEKKI